MSHASRPLRALPLLALPLLAACGPAELTQAEAREALTQVVSAARGESATNEVIEVSTEFTLGQAAADAAEELRAWWASQAPCATVSREGATVTVDFGDLSDDCTYNEHSYGGLATITLSRVETGSVQVDWGFQAMTDGEVVVDGDATVTWAGGENPSRRVVHDLSWDHDGEIIDATGDRTISLIDPELGLSEGIRIDGVRGWLYEDQDWTLEIDQVEARPTDPVPQSGAYLLTTPAGKTATLSFLRLDEDTIQVTFSGVRGGDRVYEVSRYGVVTEQ